MVEYVYTADTTQPEDTVITARKASTRTLPRTLHTEGFANVSLLLLLVRLFTPILTGSPSSFSWAPYSEIVNFLTWRI